MKTIFYILILFCFASSCQQKPELKSSNSTSSLTKKNTDVFYHYSVWYAFINKIYDGTLTAKELKTKGDIALGSYNGLDGELVMVDGKLYQVNEDGKVNFPTDDYKVCFANAAFFHADKTIDLKGSLTFDSLRSHILSQLPSKNLFYAFRVKGKFDYIKCGSVHNQEKPYNKTLDEIVAVRPVFEKENTSGTMVGFYCPEYIGQINVSGFHFHFMADDETFGGHLLDFSSNNLNVEIDFLSEYHFVLPNTPEYLNGTFEKEFDYGTK